MKRNNKHILVINHSCHAGGATVSLRNLLKIIIQDHSEVQFEVVHLDSGPRLAEFNQLCHETNFAIPKPILHRVANKVIRRLTGRHYTSYQLPDTLRNKVLDGQYDCIFVNTVVPLPMVVDWLPSVVPIYCWVHELDNYCHQLFGNDHIRLMTLPITYIACSSAVDKFLTRIKPVRTSMILSECIEADYFENVRKSKLGPTSTLSVGMIGTVDKRKGYDLFISVASKLKSSMLPIQFKWIGYDTGDSVADFQRLIDEHDLRSYIGLVPYQKSSTGAFRDLDVLLLTSREDPNPLVVMEALASGVVPIVQEGTGGAVRHATLAGGFVVEYESVNQMAKSIVSLVNNFDELHERSSKGSTYALDYLHPRSVAQQFVQILFKSDI